MDRLILLPFLKIAVIWAYFHSAGNWFNLYEVSNNIFNGGTNSCRSSYSIRGWMLSGPSDLVTFRFFNLSNILTCSLNIGSHEWRLYTVGSRYSFSQMGQFTIREYNLGLRVSPHSNPGNFWPHFGVKLNPFFPAHKPGFTGLKTGGLPGFSGTRLHSLFTMVLLGVVPALQFFFLSP